MSDPTAPGDGEDAVGDLLSTAAAPAAPDGRPGGVGRASALRSAEARPTPPGRPSGAAGAAAVLSRSPTASSPSPGAVGSDISASPLDVASGVEATTIWQNEQRRARRESQRRTTEKTPRVAASVES